MACDPALKDIINRPFVTSLRDLSLKNRRDSTMSPSQCFFLVVEVMNCNIIVLFLQNNCKKQQYSMSLQAQRPIGF